MALALQSLNFGPGPPLNCTNACLWEIDPASLLYFLSYTMGEMRPTLQVGFEDE